MEQRISSTWTPVLRWLGPIVVALIGVQPIFFSGVFAWRVVGVVWILILCPLLILASRELVDVFVCDGVLLIRGPRGVDEVEATRISAASLDFLSVSAFGVVTAVVSFKSPCKLGKSIRFIPPQFPARRSREVLEQLLSAERTSHGEG